MPIARLHIARFLAVWLLIVPFKTTVWQHLCLASGSANISLFEPTADPCTNDNTKASPSDKPCYTVPQQSSRTPLKCCAKTQTPTSTGSLLSIHQQPLVALDYSPQTLIAAHNNCCETQLQTLGFDSDRVGKNASTDIGNFDIQATPLPYVHKASAQPLFVAYAPLLPLISGHFSHGPPLPYGRKKLNMIQVYRC